MSGEKYISLDLHTDIHSITPGVCKYHKSQFTHEPAGETTTNNNRGDRRTAKSSPEIRLYLAFEWSCYDFYAAWPFAMMYVCVCVMYA